MKYVCIHSGASFSKRQLSDELEWKEEFRLQNDGYSLLRVEILNEKKDRIAFTNPIYIHRNTEKG